MRATIIAVGVIVVLSFFVVFTIDKRLALKCSYEEELKETIRQMFDADSVFLTSSSWFSDIPDIKSMGLFIVNGTTSVLDFKTLPAEYRRLDCIDKVENELMKEAENVARLLLERCNSEKFNCITVYFSKYSDDGHLVPLWQYHFTEELFPEKWKKQESIINLKCFKK